MLVKIGIWTLAALGLIFVILPFFNVTFFDMQCEENLECVPACTSRTILPEGKAESCASEAGPEAGCYKNCASRNKKCGFDEDFAKSCVDCVSKCTEAHAGDEAALSLCYDLCYSINETIA